MLAHANAAVNSKGCVNTVDVTLMLKRFRATE